MERSEIAAPTAPSQTEGSSAADREAQRRDLAVMLTLALAVLTANFFWGEIILLGSGFGVDGISYATIARGFPEILNEGVGPLYAGRILPPIAVHLLMRATGTPFEDANIIAAFKIYNALLVLGSIVLWTLISRHLGLSRRARWLGFIALYVNCALLEYALYYPVLTDVTAFFIAMAMLYCALVGHSAALYLLTFAGAFTWPTLMYLGLVLFVFPLCRETVEPTRKIYPRLVGIASILGVAAGLAVAAAIGFREGLTGEWILPAPWGYGVFALSAVFLFAYVFVVSRDLSNHERYFTRPTSYLSRQTAVRGVLAVLLYLSVGYLTTSIMTHQGQFLREQFLVSSLLRATQRPLVFYVMHVSFFGPIALLAVYHWKRIVPRVQSYGLGMTLFAVLSTVLLIQPLSRQSITILPALAMFVGLVMDEELRAASRRELWAFAGLAFLLSRAWLPVNYVQEHWPITDDPIFYFRINYSKWFSDVAFIPQLILVLGLSSWVFSYLRKRDDPAAIAGSDAGSR
ncbi:MAG: hypothetical protein AAF560_02500 [Acidobacteriota bacterium]